MSRAEVLEPSFYSRNWASESLDDFAKAMKLVGGKTEVKLSLGVLEITSCSHIEYKVLR